jgi:hypothetical protein
VDLMLKRLEEAVNVRHAMLAALDLPMNAKAQIAHLEAIGGMYGTWKLLKREAVG